MSAKWDHRFLELAKHVSQWSKDPSTQVGAVIANGKVAVSMGFNGFPQGAPDDVALYENRDEKYARIVHGEMNALVFAGRPVSGANLYTFPFAPCDRCVVVMLQAGISRFVFPALTEEKRSRWGESMARSKKFIEEMDRDWVEYPVWDTAKGVQLRLDERPIQSRCCAKQTTNGNYPGVYYCVDHGQRVA